jgi:hypothetical protein
MRSSPTARTVTAGGKAPRAFYLSGSLGQVAELADALDLGSSGATRQSSSLCLPTSHAIRGSSSVVEHRLAKARVASSNLVFR